MSKFEELKEQSATGLQFLIQQRKYTDISVELQPSYIIVPELGEYRKYVFHCRNSVTFGLP